MGKAVWTDTDQPVRGLSVRFAMVWFLAWAGFKPDHVQGYLKMSKILISDLFLIASLELIKLLFC